MSTRALKKLQRRQQEVAIESSDSSDSESESDEDITRSNPQKNVLNPFDILNAQTGKTDSIEESDASEPENAVNLENEEDTKNSEPQKKVNKKKQQKKKKKPETADKNIKDVETPRKDIADDELKEIDEAIAELKLKYGDESKRSKEGAAAAIEVPNESKLKNELASLLSVNTSFLNPDLEIRKIFGRIVEKRSVNSRRSNVRRRRYVLVQPQEGWPVLARSGLNMRLIEQTPDGVCFFEFTQSRAYQEVQETFEFYVQIYDPNNLFMLLRSHPFHIDTLLQVAEIIDQQGDHELPVDLISRALFAFDSALHPKFNLATGTARLPFLFPTNRRLYLCIWRYMQSLQSRGCWRTVFEFCKVLLQLDPSDPYAICSCIDTYAIRRGEFGWVVNFANYLENTNQITKLPNFFYSSALAMYKMYGDTEETRLTMLAAIERAPYMLGKLFESVRLPANELIIPEPQDPVQELNSELYAMRSRDNWASPDVLSFLQSILKNEKFTLNAVQGQYSDITENLARHLILLNERTLQRFLPKRILQRTIVSFDPLPPDSYTDEPQVFGRDTSRRLANYLSNTLFRNQGENGTDANNVQEANQDPNHPVHQELMQRLEEDLGDSSSPQRRTFMSNLRSFIANLFVATDEEGTEQNDEEYDAGELLEESDYHDAIDE
ncbi:ribosome quality control complex (RQC) complex subunit Rqc1 [Schizosaccharomyces osmophilus]|uniref:Ribosome quality control complex (RQC) complex subunit Rqc1 n=1 Tax=Schizosaccharomyces osmophilus TaxID=2545709 RepID=A0AAF0AY08_9SCHI|nr:ribosome quality control complex (RQC) complex subunit Rqc1 [Schizosaccharomyces osmophilus]WBW74388.1 ribosome quality control complex (RQC) complex subunit Rqc1 [Schizosaccharomyces osmophilus]